MEERQHTMGNIYSAVYINVSNDTEGLVQTCSIKTQYKESHFFTPSPIAEQEEEQ